MPTKTLPSILLALVLTGCAAQKELTTASSSEPSFAIRNVRIFDGERVIPSGTVLIRGDRIAAVGQDVDLSGVNDVIDGQGETLLPGLIDSHFHADSPDAYRTSLAFGITTVLDMFGEFSVFSTKAASLRDLSHRPDDEADAVVSVLITAPHGHGTEYGNFPQPKISTPQECRQAVNAELDAGATFVKLIYDAGESWAPTAVPTLSKEVLAACVQAAHDRGTLAVVHVFDLNKAREAIDAGVDGLTHGIVDSMPDPSFAATIAAHKAFVIPTLAVFFGAMRQRNDEQILSDPRLEPYLPASGIKSLKSSYPEGFAPGMKPSVLLEFLHQLKGAGVPLLAGSDCTNPRTAVGATLHQELELLVSAGLTPVETLTAATSVPASRFKLADRGRIAPGLRADLLLVRGDPTTDIRMTRDIVAIWKRGKKLDREGYRAQIAATRQQAQQAQNGTAR